MDKPKVGKQVLYYIDDSPEPVEAVIHAVDNCTSDLYADLAVGGNEDHIARCIPHRSIADTGQSYWHYEK